MTRKILMGDHHKSLGIDDRHTLDITETMPGAKTPDKVSWVTLDQYVRIDMIISLLEDIKPDRMTMSSTLAKKLQRIKALTDDLGDDLMVEFDKTSKAVADLQL